MWRAIFLLVLAVGGGAQECVESGEAEAAAFVPLANVATKSAVVHKLSQSNGLAAESEAADTPEDAAILRLSARCGVEIDKP